MPRLRHVVQLAFVVASASCERAQPPPARPLAAVAPAPKPDEPADDASETWLPKPLPRHGYVVGGGGLGGFSTIVVDYDARTLRYRSESYMEARAKLDQSVSISDATVASLRTLAAAAEREQPHGEMPEITDVGEMFHAIDGDHHVDIGGTLFDATGLGEPVAWRPMAARVFDETYRVAKSLGVKQ
jgi:hypothetical protein